MKNIIKTIGIAGAIAFVFAAVLVLTKTPEEAKGSSANHFVVFMTKGGGSSTATQPATTTEGVTYLAAAATTTFPFYTEHADLIGITARMTASTSAGTLLITYETSNSDESCHTDPNKCEWSNPATITSGAAASTTPTTLWRPDGALNATSSLYFVINPATARFVRVKASVTGSAAALWFSASAKTQNP